MISTKAEKRVYKICTLILILGFISIGIGSLYNQVPKWPNKYIWAFLALATALLVMLYYFFVTEFLLRVASLSVIVSALFRGMGYLLTGNTAGIRLAGAGVWAIVVVLAIGQHHHERKRYL